MRFRWISPVLAFGLVALGVSPAHADELRPLFRLPFQCGQDWVGNTYNGHSPNTNSLDFTKSGGGTNGQSILASAAGTVTFAGWNSGGGWMVEMRHADGWGTSYLHMNEAPAVGANQSVSQGHVLGHVGSTGDSSGPHLHYQQWKDRPAKTVRAVIDGYAVTVAVGRSQTLRSQNCGPQGIGNAAAGKCLDAWGDTAGENGGKVVLWDCWGGSTQSWYWDGTQLRNSVAGKCLDAWGDTAGDNGGTVALWDCWGGKNQQWYRDGNQIRNAVAGKCLDARADTADQNGGELMLWDCWGGPNQQWS